MSEWIVSIAGTPEGARLATILALISAIAHAAFGALQKGRHDPWLTRGAIDVWLIVLSIPVVLFLVPVPSGQMFWVLLGSLAIHFLYKLSIAMAYEKAAYTVVYPVMRGTGPLVTVAAAAVIFQETFTPIQWLGVAALSGGILLLALRNLTEESIDPMALRIGLAWALLGGIFVAFYTTWDAYGIRLAADPFSFLAWFFLITALDFPVITWLRYRRMSDPPTPGPLMLRGFVGALIAYVSFGGVMLATRVGKVGEAAVLRETSTVFAALIGWLFLKERVGPRKAALMALIAAGAVLVELGG